MSQKQKKILNKGVVTALITPFQTNGEVDYDSFESLLDQQWKGGVQQFVINGTTGESPTLELNEIEQLIFRLKKRYPDAFVMVGSGSNSTRRTIEMTQKVTEFGADMALVVVPYYNKPSQAGLKAHFSKVAENVNLPIMLYNVPGRTVISLSADTISQLAAIKNISCIKEASGAMALIDDYQTHITEGFVSFSGDDESCLEFCLHGGKGVVSVISHLLPSKICEFIEGSIAGDEKYSEGYKEFLPLVKSIYMEPNPTPVKKALKEMGVIASSRVRLPLVEMQEKNVVVLLEQMKKVGLLR